MDAPEPESQPPRRDDADDRAAEGEVPESQQAEPQPDPPDDAPPTASPDPPAAG